MPTMREETVTKKNPKTTTSRPISERAREGAVREARQDRDEEREDDRADDDDPHAEVALGADRALAPRRRCRSDFTDSRKAETIVGSVLMSVITPAQATAPAPM